MLLFREINETSQKAKLHRKGYYVHLFYHPIRLNAEKLGGKRGKKGTIKHSESAGEIYTWDDLLRCCLWGSIF